MHKSSFSKRLTLRIVLALTLILLLVTIGILQHAFKNMWLMTSAYYEHLADIEKESVEKKLHDVQIAIHNSIDEVEWKLNNPDSVSLALKNKLKLNPKVIIGFGAAFEPHYYPQKGLWFEPYAIWRDGKIEVLLIGSASHNYFTDDWYRRGMASEEGAWSEPYLDTYGAHMLLCTYSVPIHDISGRKVGVFGGDISLDMLQEYLKDKDLITNTKGIIKVSEDYKGDKKHWVYSFIVGRKGYYISHPDKQRILRDNLFKAVRKNADPEGERMINDMIAGKKGSARTSIDGEDATIFYAPLEHSGWSLAVVLPNIRQKTIVFTYCFYLAIFLLLGMLVVYVICLITISHSTRPLQHLAKSADEVAKGNFNAPLPDLDHDDEIRQLRDSFGNMQQSLSQYIDELQTTTAQKSVYEYELSIAHDIQMAMLPSAFPDRPDIDMYAMQTPAKAVGGDLYDFLLCKNRLYFCIGDVSGKGVPAALVMAMASSAFQLLAEGCPEPQHIISRMNDSMTRNNELGLFITFFVGELDIDTGHLRFCNAGHSAPLINGKAIPVDSNLPIGVMPNYEFTVQETDLAHGDTLFLYTDGLDEAENDNLELFGKQRIYETLQASSSPQPRTLIEHMTKAVADFVGDTEQSDDLTMFALQWK